ncbi:hypothetical protein PU560_03980, partial [Georgenia sp. 10Sc9-8]|nr:hypothetical protein [Georgenia halotolerans]
MKLGRPVTATLAAAASAAVVLGLAPAAGAADGTAVGGEGSTYLLNDRWSGDANIEVSYGAPDDPVYIGNWNGDGSDTLAVR